MENLLQSLNLELSAEVLTKAGLKILSALLILIIAYIIYRLIRRGVEALRQQEIIPLVVSRLVQKTLKYFFIIIAVFLILQNFGVGPGALWGALSGIIALVAIGFVAVWSVISNSLCAVLLIITKPFRIGDHVELLEPASKDPGRAGTVTNISFIYTTLLEKNKKDVIMIPNNLFFQKTIRTHAGKKTYSLDEQLMTHESLLERK